ncbi:MAG: metallophosphoesterase family protein [Opitutus sp.]|nr:metallophosphoesterase family protein [Opitutus sp.]
MASTFTRIFSDLHYGDRSSTLRELASLRPLLDGPDRVIFNGDTLDTRPSRHPERVAELRGSVLDFVQHHAPPATLITGNHDPDISDVHALELAEGEVLVSHGDVIFDDLVPWSREATQMGRLMREALATFSESERATLAARLRAMRHAAAQIPQRHHTESDALKHAIGLFTDMCWPPTRVLRVVQAWRDTPRLAAALLAQHRPDARVFVMGHTHRAGVRQIGGGKWLINTGAFCPPTRACVVDVSAEKLVVREVERRRGVYRIGSTRAEFSLAAEPVTVTLAA